MDEIIKDPGFWMYLLVMGFGIFMAIWAYLNRAKFKNQDEN
jgi:hypothetical protein